MAKIKFKTKSEENIYKYANLEMKVSRFFYLKA